MKMPETNKVRYGLSNVHVGTVKVEDGTPTFGVPKAYPGAVNMTLNAEGESSTFYADNIAYYVTNSNNGYTGDLEMAYLYDWFETQFLGSKESQEGMIVETSDNPTQMAYLMFQFEGDVNATKYIIYNITFGRPDLEGNTKEDTTEPNTTTIPFTSVPLVTEFGNVVKSKVPITASNYATFFTTAPTVPTKKSE
jgi:phi13 family phage major tail protein